MWKSALRIASSGRWCNVLHKSVTRPLVTTRFVVTRTTNLPLGAKVPFVAIIAGIPLLAKSPDAWDQLRNKADELFEQGKYQELLRFLQEQESWYDKCDLLWRVARCKFHLSKEVTDNKKKQEWLNDSLVNVERALEINPECGPAHKWAAILIDSVSTLEGTKSRIEKTLVVKEHMEEAIRLMPDDATSYYVLGEWHFTVSTIGWAQKKIASVIFATFPESSLEIALENFEKAEKVKPGFYSKNLVLLAKTLNTLGRDKERAKESLLKVVQQYSSSTKWDDKEAVAEAKTLLAKMGVKV